MYWTLKKMASILVTKDDRNTKAKEDITRMALNFTPGKSPVYLQDWERQVIVRWLIKLHNLAETRDQLVMGDRFRTILEVFK